MKPQIILSLFDGMSCGQIALRSMGVPIAKYYASEIDKPAITVCMANHPDTIQLGDVTRWREWDIDWASVDLVLAGSPCQGFSFAGKMLAFDDPRSALFFVFVEIWRHVQAHNPKAHFLLENVKMRAADEVVISRHMGIAPIDIDSALVSAQTRKRLYWTNIASEPYGLFGDMRCAIEQPKDRGVLLKDILQKDVPEKYFLSEKMLQYFNRRKANFNGGKINVRDVFGKASTITASSASCDISDNFIKYTTALEPSKIQDKASCFTAGGNSGGLHSDMDLIRVHSLQPRTGKGKGGKGHLSKSPMKTYCLDTRNGMAIEFNNCQNSYRRLTTTECERLQTVPDGYTAHVSDTQRYRMLGNGWTVDVIKYILSHLYSITK